MSKPNEHKTRHGLGLGVTNYYICKYEFNSSGKGGTGESPGTTPTLETNKLL